MTQNTGDFHFSDNNSWFNHGKDKLEKMDEIECNWGEKCFMTQPEFLNHRKKSTQNMFHGAEM